MNEQSETPLKKKPNSDLSKFKIAVRRLITPENWSLQGRFLYLSGVLLAIGSVFLIWLFSYSLKEQGADGADEKLAMLDSWVQDRLASEREDLLAQLVPVTTMPEVLRTVRDQNRQALMAFIQPYVERLRQSSSRASLYFHFHVPPATSFLRTWDPDRNGDDLSTHRNMVVRCNKNQISLKGIEVGQGGAQIRAIMPLYDKDGHIGSVEIASSLEGVLQSIDLPQNFSMSLLLDKQFQELGAGNLLKTQYGNWIILKNFGQMKMEVLTAELAKNILPKRVGNIFYRYVPLEDYQGKLVGGILLSYDAKLALASIFDKSIIFSLVYFSGALALWLILYLNIRRIKNFLHRLKRVFIATNSGDFSERFEADPVHCLDVLKCGNQKCPVYRNPSLICYLETGSQAISPALRNTCIFVAKYGKCEQCPVYALRHGDELVEMRHAVNTMMRLWGVFVSRISHLLAEVLYVRRDYAAQPSLEDISDSFEHMAGLTVFSHDLQGVYSKKEVYDQLTHVFQAEFGLRRFAIFEVNNSENRMDVMVDCMSGGHVISPEMVLNAELCRAKRVVEGVCSENNPALCPYFNINHTEDVRCCLPMVMGGRVGAVFSFILKRERWESERAKLDIIRKYLSESAPVLSSLRLLQASREQSLTDPLTGAHNRRFLDEYIVQCERLAKREDQKLGFIMADLDFFKQINDTHGHLAGDAILKEVVKIIRQTIRSSDVVVRYGGEEFLMLLHNVNPGASDEVAEKIRRNVEEHGFTLPSGERLHKTISLGVAEYPADGDAIYKAIKFADVALYEAKRGGRNRVEHFKAEMWTEENY